MRCIPTSQHSPTNTGTDCNFSRIAVVVFANFDIIVHRNKTPISAFTLLVKNAYKLKNQFYTIANRFRNDLAWRWSMDTR